MNKICTSIEQSQKLIELGIDVNTADMCWSLFNLIINGNKDINQILLPISYKRVTKQPAPDFIERFPAWSLTALLELIQDNIKIEKTLFDQSNMFTHSIIGDAYQYRSHEHENLIDAAFEMVCWLLESKKL